MVDGLVRRLRLLDHRLGLGLDLAWRRDRLHFRVGRLEHRVEQVLGRGLPLGGVGVGVQVNRDAGGIGHIGDLGTLGPVGPHRPRRGNLLGQVAPQQLHRRGPLLGGPLSGYLEIAELVPARVEQLAGRRRTLGVGRGPIAECLLLGLGQIDRAPTPPRVRRHRGRGTGRRHVDVRHVVQAQPELAETFAGPPRHVRVRLGPLLHARERRRLVHRRRLHRVGPLGTRPAHQVHHRAEQLGVGPRPLRHRPLAFLLVHLEGRHDNPRRPAVDRPALAKVGHGAVLRLTRNLGHVCRVACSVELGPVRVQGVCRGTLGRSVIHKLPLATATEQWVSTHAVWDGVGVALSPGDLRLVQRRGVGNVLGLVQCPGAHDRTAGTTGDRAHQGAVCGVGQGVAADPLHSLVERDLAAQRIDHVLAKRLEDALAELLGAAHPGALERASRDRCRPAVVPLDHRVAEPPHRRVAQLLEALCRSTAGDTLGNHRQDALADRGDHVVPLLERFFRPGHAVQADQGRQRRRRRTWRPCGGRRTGHQARGDRGANIEHARGDRLPQPTRHAVHRVDAGNPIGQRVLRAHDELAVGAGVERSDLTGRIDLLAGQVLTGLIWPQAHIFGNGLHLCLWQSRRRRRNCLVPFGDSQGRKAIHPLTFEQAGINARGVAGKRIRGLPLELRQIPGVGLTLLGRAGKLGLPCRDRLKDPLLAGSEVLPRLPLADDRVLLAHHPLAVFGTGWRGRRRDDARATGPARQFLPQHVLDGGRHHILAPTRSSRA